MKFNKLKDMMDRSITSARQILPGDAATLADFGVESERAR
jgi:hypothetical protein